MDSFSRSFSVAMSDVVSPPCSLRRPTYQQEAGKVLGLLVLRFCRTLTVVGRLVRSGCPQLSKKSLNDTSRDLQKGGAL